MACILTGEMRALVIGVLFAALAGCGGSKSDAPVAAEKTARPEAPEVVYLFRVQGDDPLPDSLSLRADGRAHVRRGGGHAGFRSVEVALNHADVAKSIRLVARAPWKALDGHTVTPGEVTNDAMRYMVRRGKRSITVSAAHMPRSLRPLIRNLDAIIDGDVGRRLSSRLHSAIASTANPQP
jgi:hypothetical protein